MSRSFIPTTTTIFLYVPNLIGYVRVILAIVAFYYIRQPELFLPLYGVSCLLDVADGYAARWLGQCSRFGSVLDMVTDRCSTAGLLCHLCSVYPQWTLAFQLLVALDLSSHYMHMYSSLAAGSTNHKNVDARQNVLLRLYYTSRVVLFVACALNETFFMSLYMIAYRPAPMVTVRGLTLSIWLVVMAISAPVWAFKQFMNVIQLTGAAKRLAEMDAQAAIFAPKLAAKRA